jgi:hypothetical protein
LGKRLGPSSLESKSAGGLSPGQLDNQSVSRLAHSTRVISFIYCKVNDDEVTEHSLSGKLFIREVSEGRATFGRDDDMYR